MARVFAVRPLDFRHRFGGASLISLSLSLSLMCALLAPVPGWAQTRDYAPGPPDPTASGAISFDPAGPDGPDAIDADAIPAHVALLDGSVWLDRDADSGPAEENTPLVAGDRLRTARGRVEILFADGSTLDLDENTVVELLADSLLRLRQGTLRLTLTRADAPVDYRIDAAGATAMLRAPGDYRVALLPSVRSSDPALRVTSLRGMAELTSPSGQTVVRAGTESIAGPQSAPSAAYAVNTTSWDSFDQWVDRGRDDRLSATSVQYLPADLRYYGSAFDRDGSWQYDRPYGYVWYPRVGVDWRPYSTGRWSFVASVGWIWVGVGASSWPTHHYGRWGVSSGRWFWIPDRQFAPAWVSWASAPGYVGWCPLGYDNRPVVSISVYNTDPRRGWSTASSRLFAAHGFNGRQTAIARADAPRGVQFVQQRGGPGRPSGIRADQRALRSPTAAARVYAMPRGSASQTFETGTAYRGRPAAASPDRRTSTAPQPQSQGRVDAGSRRAGSAPSGPAARTEATIPAGQRAQTRAASPRERTDTPPQRSGWAGGVAARAPSSSSTSSTPSSSTPSPSRNVGARDGSSERQAGAERNRPPQAASQPAARSSREASEASGSSAARAGAGAASRPSAGSSDNSSHSGSRTPQASSNTQEGNARRR